MDEINEKNIHFLYEATVDNYYTLINSDVYTNYGIYKSGNIIYINKISELLYNYIITNFDINTDNIKDWILVVPSVNKNTNLKLISIMVNRIKYLLDIFYIYNFKVCYIYRENDENIYNYSAINNYNERNKLLSKNLLEFSENIDLSSRKILLIDDSIVYGVTMANNIKVLKRLNIKLDNLFILAYIKANKEVLEKITNFENILNHQWYYNKFNIEFNTLDFCKYFIINYKDYFFTIKVIIMFLKLDYEDFYNIKKLLINNSIFYKKFLNECKLHNLNIEKSIYYEKYLLYEKIYNDI